MHSQVPVNVLLGVKIEVVTSVIRSVVSADEGCSAAAKPRMTAALTTKQHALHTKGQREDITRTRRPRQLVPYSSYCTGLGRRRRGCGRSARRVAAAQAGAAAAAVVY